MFGKGEVRSSREDGEGGKRREEATEESKGCRDKKRERGREEQTSRINVSSMLQISDLVSHDGLVYVYVCVCVCVIM